MCSCILARTLLKMLFLREAASTQDPRMGYSFGFRNLKNITLFCFYRHNVLTDHLSLFTLVLGKLRAKLQWRSAKIYYLIPGLTFLFPCLPFSGFFMFVFFFWGGEGLSLPERKDNRKKNKKKDERKEERVGEKKKYNSNKKILSAFTPVSSLVLEIFSIIIRLSIY